MNHIQDFDLFLREEYGIKDSYTNHIGTSIPEKGGLFKLGIEEWLFHGGGCSLYFYDDLEIHWNFTPLDVEGIKTSPWKLFTFIDTFY